MPGYGEALSEMKVDVMAGKVFRCFLYGSYSTGRSSDDARLVFFESVGGHEMSVELFSASEGEDPFCC